MTISLNTKAVDVLTEVLSNFGSKLIEDRERIYGILSDSLQGDCQEEQDLLMLALRYGVVKSLMKYVGDCNAVELVALTNQFQQQTKYLTIEAAHFAIHGWSYALSASTKPKALNAPAAIVPVTLQQRTLFASIACCLVSVGIIFMMSQTTNSKTGQRIVEQADLASEMIANINNHTKPAITTQAAELPKEPSKRIMRTWANAIAQPLVGKSYVTPEIQLLPEGKVHFFKLSKRGWGKSSSETPSIRIGDEYLSWNPWTEYEQDILQMQLVSAYAELKSFPTRDLHLYFYYPSDTTHFLDTYRVSFKKRSLQRWCWAYQKSREVAPRWYYLGKARYPYPAEFSTFFTTRQPLSLESGKRLVRSLYVPNLQEKMLTKIKAAQPLSAELATH